MSCSASGEKFERVRNSHGFIGPGRSWAWAVALGVVGIAFGRPALAGCKSNEECKGGRVCSANGDCVAADEGKDPQATCQRDIDCAADDICEQNMCVPVMPNAPGTKPTPLMPPPGQPQPGQPPPPPPPPPEFQQQHPPPAPPPEYEQPPPPPEYQQPPPPPPPPYANPPYPYPRRLPFRRPVELMPWRFDVLLGATFLTSESNVVDVGSNDFGISLDAQLAKGVAPNLAIGIRAGAVLIPYAIDETTAYGALGLYSNTYHWGLFLGGGTAVSPDANIRQGGFVVDIPIDWALGPFFKIGFAIGLGFYRDFEQQNIRLCIGL